jgi:hypothetical protein
VEGIRATKGQLIFEETVKADIHSMFSQEIHQAFIQWYRSEKGRDPNFDNQYVNNKLDAFTAGYTWKIPASHPAEIALETVARLKDIEIAQLKLDLWRERASHADAQMRFWQLELEHRQQKSRGHDGQH